MEEGTQTGTNRLFVVIALVLTGSLLLGLLGIGGLVVMRYIRGPVEVAMPVPEEAPTNVPVGAATPTATALPSATPTPVQTPAPAPTATLVVAQGTGTVPVEGTAGGTGQDGPGMSSPSPESSEMPETGLGPSETLVAAFALVAFLAGARLIRHRGAGGDA